MLGKYYITVNEICKIACGNDKEGTATIKFTFRRGVNAHSEEEALEIAKKANYSQHVKEMIERDKYIYKFGASISDIQFSRKKDSMRFNFHESIEASYVSSIDTKYDVVYGYNYHEASIEICIRELTMEEFIEVYNDIPLN